MKVVYPVIISTVKTEEFYDVFIPDLEINTEGSGTVDCIEMARDAIGAKCITLEDLKCDIPVATSLSSVIVPDNSFITLVDVDLSEYRRKNDLKTVRRNVTLPSWLDYQAEKSGINVSALLQKALKQELNLQ